jgi:hypothetical protein
MALPSGIIERFEDDTKYPLTEYLEKYVDFISTKYKSIYLFYTGKISKIDNEPFDILEELLEESNRVDDVIDLNKGRLSTTAAYWELLESITNIKITLQTAKNARKWLRSSVSKGRNGVGIRSNTSLRFYQTLESLSKEIGSSDKENSWFRLSMENDLTEEDYTPEGGASVSTTGFGATGISINSVVDEDIIGEKVYGIDLNRKLTFASGENDFEVLTYYQTLEQNTLVLATLTRGKTPEFDEDGVQSSLVAGSNRASIAYPILIRQYRNTFARDDSYRVMRVSDIKNTMDSLSITLELKTVLDEPVLQTITL